MIGAYYRCYENLAATQEVLINFRKFYPFSTIVLVNDGNIKYNNEFKSLANKFNCIYFCEKDNLGFPGNKSSMKEIILWIERFLLFSSFIKEEYFVLLEDDVYFSNTINTNLLLADCNSYINKDNVLPCICKKDKCKCYDWLESRNKELKQPYYYGCMGGTIFSTKFIHKLFYDKVDLNIFQEFENICKDVKRNYFYSDVGLSILILYYGGSISSNHQICEIDDPQYNKLKNLGIISISHKDKSLYIPKFEKEPEFDKYKLFYHKYSSKNKYSIVIKLIEKLNDEEQLKNIVSHINHFYEFTNHYEVDRIVFINFNKELGNKFLSPFNLVFIDKLDNSFGFTHYIKTNHCLYLPNTCILNVQLNYNHFFQNNKIVYGYQRTFDEWFNTLKDMKFNSKNFNIMIMDKPQIIITRFCLYIEHYMKLGKLKDDQEFIKLYNLFLILTYGENHYIIINKFE